MIERAWRAIVGLGVGLGVLVVWPGVAGAGTEECVGDWPNPDACFPDILCNQYEAFWDLRRAVVHIYGPDILGTGVLINNASCHSNNSECGTPYLLTAHHVASSFVEPMSDGERYSIENLTAFTFGLEAAFCGGPTAGGAVALDGATVIIEAPEEDLLLLQLSTSLPPELGAYFVGWEFTALDQAISISHPCGAPKRIAISEPDEVYFQHVMDKDIYTVRYWQEGALAGGSSGAPLLDISTGALQGVFTETDGAGAYYCFEPSLASIDQFTALTSILDVLPASVDGHLDHIDAYDLNTLALPIGTVADSSYYGDGEIIDISAEEQVLLVDGFFADSGSTVWIHIEP